MHSKPEALIEKYSINKGVLQKAVIQCTAVFL